MTDSRQSPSAALPGFAPTAIAFSCRLPLLVLFVSAAVWLVIASAFALIASIKFHGPGFLANSAWLTYGRVYPAYLNSVLYGCCLQAGLGVMLWVFTHLGRTTLPHRWLVTIGAILWNLGVTVGVVGILAGESTGFETLEMPSYAALLIFIGYLLIGVWAAICFHQRRQRALFVSQWFMLTALFWFPWIYSSAELLLVTFPVRGVAQAVIAWWYADNLLLVWLSLVGLAAVFYFLPKLTGRELHSHYLALFTFWMLILFGSWAGIPSSAPVPAWMPTLSTIASVLMVIPVIAVGLNVYRTLKEPGSPGVATEIYPSLPFVFFGAAAFIIAGAMKAAGALLDTHSLLQLTWFGDAQRELHFYGFFVMVMFGGVYRVLPQLTDTQFPWPKLVRIHFWLAAAGVALWLLPVAIAGIVEVSKLADPSILPVQITQATAPFLRVSTIGILLLGLGHLLFLANLSGLVVSFYRAKASAAYAEMTADLFKTAGAKS